MNPPLIAIDARLVCGQSTGDSTYWTGLLQGLAQIDTDFRYLLLTNAPPPPGIPESPNFAWKVVPARSSRWWSAVTFPLAARRAGARAIHAQYSLSPLCGRVGITTVHDVSFFIGPEWFRTKDRLLLQTTVPPSVRRAARVVTVSETSLRDIVKYIPAAKGKIRATPLAASPDIVPMDPGAAGALVKQELGLSGPFALTVGTRWPRKNMKLAVEAVNALPESLPLKLAITGKPGWGEGELGTRAVATGYVSTGLLSALYSAADLYLAPSHYEGFGLTLLEAFVCGCPVVCSQGGAHPEVAGDAAALAQSQSPRDWTALITELMADKDRLNSMRERGLKRAAAFSWKRMAAATLEVYREVIE